MTKVLVRPHCCPAAAVTLQLFYGTENLLDDLHGAWAAGGFSAAALVGSGLDVSHPFHLVVGRLPQRLVRLISATSGLGHGETAPGGVVASGAPSQGPKAGDRGAGKRGPV